MKKRIYQLLALLCLTCLWGCLSGFTSGSQNTVSFLYECGEWAGKTGSSYEGELSSEKPSGAGTLTFTYGGTDTGDFKDSHSVFGDYGGFCAGAIRDAIPLK